MKRYLVETSIVRAVLGQSTTAHHLHVQDAIIALEQPPECTLLHLDEAYDLLCPALGRAHKKVRSVRAVEGPLRIPDAPRQP